jgi:aminoglycoside phosphotransferase (APT) family kinase protein
MDYTDRASDVRAGQEIDPERLAAYLEAQLGFSGPLSVQQFPRGYSNLTYLLQLPGRELVLRRAPPGVKIKTAHDMAREHRILSHLAPVWPKAPRPLLLCEDESIAGTAFYVMERVSGVILRARAPEGLDLGPERMRRIGEAVVDTLAEIHALDYAAIGLGDLGKPEGYVARQITGWTDRYRKAQTDDVPDFEEVGRWLAAHQPPDAGAALIHNDFKYDNVVLDTALATVVAVLDWEMATLGDPLMDLGTTLGYWVQADDPPVLHTLQVGLTHLPGNLTRAEVVERYAERTGRDVRDVLYYYVYALYKVAVVAQQLYKRYRDGLTREERYTRMLDGVKALSAAALQAIARNRIDRLA